MTAETAFHAVAASRYAPDDQSGEGGSQPTLLLHLPGPDHSQARWTIRPVGPETARRWYATYHYLGDAGTAAVPWGVFAPDLAAIVSLGIPNNVHGVAGRLGLSEFTGNIEISRVAVHPAFTAERSKIIRRVLVVGASDLDWVFSYADPKAGHHGGIYQALGAIYCGRSADSHGWAAPNGELLHPRTAVSVFGSQARADMETRGYRHVPGAFGGLHTYVLPLRNKAAIVSALAPHVRPYPKRTA